MTKQAPKCPLCGTERIWKDGFRQSKHGDVQRYICRECGYRFSETRWNGSDDPEHVQRVHREPLNTHPNLLSSRQICVTPTKGTKNLAEVESRTRNQAAGATARKPTEADTKGKIVEYAWWMKKQGYAETTIIMYTNVVGVLAKRGSNIYNPDSVKEAIAKQQWSEARKESAIAAYTLFLKMVGGHWEPPRCHPTRKIPFIPTEEEIDVLIASCGRKTSTFLQLLKETAMRLGEANSLRWIDIDLARKIITLNRPEKRSEPRIFKVSSALMDMINSLPRTSERVFGKGSCASKKSTFRKSRKRMANKLKNPRLLKTTFHTLRHWKATMLYHQKKDILYVQKFLGHKRIEDTMLYIQVAETIFKEPTDEFTVRVAENPTKIKELLEVGFEYICEKDDLMFFRKRK